MSKLFTIVLIGSISLLFVGGCMKINAQAPDVYIGGHQRSKVDSSKTPKPATIGESHAALDDAYAEIRYLEGKVKRREKKIDKLDKDKRELKSKVKKLKKRLDRYEDD